MIINLNQTRSNLNMEYEFINEYNLIYKSSIPMKFIGREVLFSNNKEALYKLGFSLKDNLKNGLSLGTNRGITPYSIKNIEGVEVGSVELRRTKLLFGYQYYEINFESSLYRAYEIGLGKEGIVIPIYKDDMQIALIEKPTKVYDNKDTYTIYIEDGKYAIAVLLFSIYFDSVNFGHYNEVVYKTQSTTYTYTLNKELKSKYNPNFKDKIINKYN